MKFTLPKLKNIFKKKEANTKVKVDYERDFHKITFDDLCARFNTSMTDGLDTASAQQKLIKDGKNKIVIKRKNPIFHILGYFFSGFCGLIWCASIVCFICWKPLVNKNCQQFFFVFSIKNFNLFQFVKGWPTRSNKFRPWHFAYFCYSNSGCIHCFSR